MKNTRRFMAAVMALTMVSALAPMSAFADTVVDNENNPAPKTAGLDVSYTYTPPAPTYTVTIPAGVTLSDSAAVEKSITAEGVANMEANGKKIVVTLDAATNDNDTDTTFHALNGESDATYTITAGTTAVKVGDTVAEFTADGSSALTFSKITLPENPVAGDYTETLTFGISVEDAVTPYTPQTYTSLTVGTVLHVGDALDLTGNLYLEHGVLNSNYIWTLVRGNISSYGEGEYVEVTFTESDNGDYYAFKGVYRTDPTTGYTAYDAIPMTATSDGITVTALNGANVRFAVHES